MRNSYTDAKRRSDYLNKWECSWAALQFLMVDHPDLAARLAPDPNAWVDRAVWVARGFLASRSLFA
jgi:hypothetical protein